MNSKRIVVIEEDEDHRNLLKETIIDQGYDGEIETAGSLSQIEEQDESYDVIISETSGWTYGFDEVREENVDIFYTGLHESEMVENLDAKRLPDSFPLEEDQTYHAVKYYDRVGKVAEAARYLEK